MLQHENIISSNI